MGKRRGRGGGGEEEGMAARGLHEIAGHQTWRLEVVSCRQTFLWYPTSAATK